MWSSWAKPQDGDSERRAPGLPPLAEPQATAAAPVRRPSMHDLLHARRSEVGASQLFHHRNLNPSKALSFDAAAAAATMMPPGREDPGEGVDGRLSFSAATFVAETVYNLVWPLSLPLGLWLEGFNGMKARALWPGGCDVGGNFGILMSALVTAGGFLPWACAQAGLCPSFGAVEVYRPAAMLLLHRCCVATKYAYMSESERQSLRDERFDGETPAVMNEIQLSGWSCQNRATILLHAKKAEARLFGDLEAAEVFFHSDRPLPPRPLVRMGLESRGRSTAGGGLGGERAPSQSKPSVFTVACAVLDCCCGRPPDAPDKIGVFANARATALCLVIALLISLVPGALRAARGVPPWGESATEAVAYALGFLTASTLTMVTFLFLYIARADFSRRAHQLRLLERMLGPGEPRLGRFRIAADDPHDCLAFVMLLRLLHETGRVFLLRMSAFAFFYLALFAARCIFIVSSFVLPLLYGSDFDVAGVVTTGIEILATASFFALITHAVGECNAGCHRLEACLLLARLELPARASDESPAFRASADAIESTLALLAHQRLHSPHEFCGLQSAAQFLRLCGAMVAACGGLAAAWLVSSTTT